MQNAKSSQSVINTLVGYVAPHSNLFSCPQPSSSRLLLSLHPLFARMDPTVPIGVHGPLLNFSGGSFVGNILSAMYVEVFHFSLLHSY